MTLLREILPKSPMDPRPLIDGPEKIGIFWSAKSGCTAVLLWFYQRIGKKEDALSFSSWPHDYRERVLYPSPEYQEWLATCDVDKTRWLRVIRDPYKRAVSSFRHAVQFGYMDKHLAPFLEHPVGHASTGISFKEFLMFLKNRGTYHDIHNFPQRHALEEFMPNLFVLNIDNVPLSEGLSNFEKYSELDPVEKHQGPLITPVGVDHRAKTFATDENYFARRMTKKDTTEAWPVSEAFLNAEARDLVQQIYAVDFDAYAEHL